MIVALGIALLAGGGVVSRAQVSPKDRDKSSADPERNIKEAARNINNPQRRHPKSTAPRNTAAPAATGRNNRTPPSVRNKPSTDLSEQIDDAIDLGNDMRKAKRYAEAERAYRFALKLDAKDERPYIGLGNIYSDQNKHLEAVEFFTQAIRYNPNNPGSYYGRGLAYYLMNKHAEAIEDGKQAVRLNTDEDNALWGIVVLYNNRRIEYSAANRLEEAVLFFQQQIRRKPDYAKAYIALGWAYELWKQPEKTVEYYRKAIAVKPDYIEAYRWLASIYEYQLKQPAEAKNVYKSLADFYKKELRARPNDAKTYALLGDVYKDNLNQDDDALEAYKQAARIDASFNSGLVSFYTTKGRYQDAVDIYRQLIRVKPDDAALYISLGDIYEQNLKQPAQATEAYKKAAELYRQQAASKPYDVEIQVNLGHAHKKLKEYDAAIAAYQRAAEIDASKYSNLVTLYGELNRHEDVVKTYRQWVLVNPDDPYLFISMGYTYKNKLNQPAAAKEAYLKAVEVYQRKLRNKPEASTYDSLGDLYRNSLEQHADALEAYKQAVRLEPNSYTYHNDVGNAYYSLGKYAEAAEAYKQVVRLYPESAYYYSNLAGAHYQAGQYQESVDAYQQAIRLSPKSDDYYNGQGNAYYAMRKYAEAIDAYKQSLLLKPEVAVYHYNLASGYRELGRYAEAVESYKQALRLEPQFVLAHFYLGETHIILNDKGAAEEQFRFFSSYNLSTATSEFKSWFMKFADELKADINKKWPGAAR